MRSARAFLIFLLFPLLPLTRCFGVKAMLLRFAGLAVGANVRVTSSARFYVGGPFSIGDNCWIGEDVLVTGGSATIDIGRNCDIGPRVTIVSGTHHLWETPERAAGAGFSLPIRLGDGVWIGAGATVLAGVTIGNGAMVAAGAVVAHDVEGQVVVAGVPARVVKRLTRPAHEYHGIGGDRRDWTTG